LTLEDVANGKSGVDTAFASQHASCTWADSATQQQQYLSTQGQHAKYHQKNGTALVASLLEF
jgi:hypothetical protein